MPVLCVDLGNTRWKGAIWHHGQLTEIFYFSPDDAVTQIQNRFRREKARCVVFSSVVAHAPEIESALRACARQFLKIEAKAYGNMILPERYVGKMGADRIGLAWGATHFYPQKNVLVISAGTCLTYNFVNTAGVFVGGSISAGLRMRLHAMHQLSTFVPLVTVNEQQTIPLIGNDTQSHLASGAAWGMVHEIAGLCDSYQNRFDDLVYVLTGGDTALLERLFQEGICRKNNLIFEQYFLFHAMYELSCT